MNWTSNHNLPLNAPYLLSNALVTFGLIKIKLIQGIHRTNWMDMLWQDQGGLLLNKQEL